MHRGLQGLQRSGVLPVRSIEKRDFLHGLGIARLHGHVLGQRGLGLGAIAPHQMTQRHVEVGGSVVGIDLCGILKKPQSPVETLQLELRNPEIVDDRHGGRVFVHRGLQGFLGLGIVLEAEIGLSQLGLCFRHAGPRRQGLAIGFDPLLVLALIA